MQDRTSTTPYVVSEQKTLAFFGSCVEGRNFLAVLREKIKENDEFLFQTTDYALTQRIIGANKAFSTIIKNIEDACETETSEANARLASQLRTGSSL